MSIQIECEQILKSEVAKAKFLTRFTPDRLVVAVSQLTDEQSMAACQILVVCYNFGKLKRKLCGNLIEMIYIVRYILAMNGIRF